MISKKENKWELKLNERKNPDPLNRIEWKVLWYKKRRFENNIHSFKKS